MTKQNRSGFIKILLHHRWRINLIKKCLAKTLKFHFYNAITTTILVFSRAPSLTLPYMKLTTMLEGEGEGGDKSKSEDKDQGKGKDKSEGEVSLTWLSS